MSARALNAEQQRAIEASGTVFVSAGAGTGKTTVLVERFCRAVLERGFPVESLLVITYTERAAGELRARIRTALRERGRPDLARELDGAWISTIHGFCNRLLRQNAVAAGIDPNFRVLDAEQALVLAREALGAALKEFGASDDAGRMSFLVSYGRQGLERMIISLHETLRSAGRGLELELAGAPKPGVPEPGAPGEGGDPGQEAWDERALADRDLIQELLRAFDGCYRRAKTSASSLDFEDLQLFARDLLRSDPRVLERARRRFRSLLVDEFQDTNRLQCEIIDLIAGEVGAASAVAGEGVEELFFVGDEYQSIYRFRHADVEVFRERRSQASGRGAGVLDLTLNYRSRPEVLGVVNDLFATGFGDEYRPLRAASEFSSLDTPAVELMITDKESYSGSGTHWRQAEARQLAERVQQLVAGGEAGPGEIVLLFGAGTDSEIYERELRERGLPTYRATGRGYYDQQQVLDLLAYLRLIHNRYDDEALFAVLASPFVGVSNDALVLLRRAAGRRPLFSGLERAVPPNLGDEDARLFRAFRQRYDRLTAASEVLSLEQLCEQIVAEHDYDLALLAQWDGRQRYANIRKLARMARSFEELRGPDIEGFVRFVTELGAAGASAQEAPAEEEGSDSVRLLTIHAAKGLEFKVVVVADAGRGAMRPAPSEILCLPDGRLGFKVADPIGGKARPALGYDQVKKIDEAQEEAERRRLYYVAMTRAIDRLIVSGGYREDRPAERKTPIGWMIGRLGIELPAVASGDTIEAGGQPLLVRLDRFSGERVEERSIAGEEETEELDETRLEEMLEEEDEDGGQLSLFRHLHPLEPPVPPPSPEPEETASPEPVGPLEPLERLAPVAAAPLYKPRRLSYSALRLFETCPYRYFAQHVCRMSPQPPERPPLEPEGPLAEGLSATGLGSAVHELLETTDLAAPSVPGRELLEETVRASRPAATDADIERIERLVGNYCDSKLAGRISALPSLETELPFVFEHGDVLVNGILDVVSRSNGRALVLDYKTNLIERPVEEIVESEYRIQRLVYALACLRGGASEVEVVYAFLEQPDAVVSRTFAAADAPALERELSELVERIDQGAFPAIPSEQACSDCPVRGIVCAGTDLPGAPPRGVGVG